MHHHYTRARCVLFTARRLLQCVQKHYRKGPLTLRLWLALFSALRLILAIDAQHHSVIATMLSTLGRIPLKSGNRAQKHKAQKLLILLNRRARNKQHHENILRLLIERGRIYIDSVPHGGVVLAMPSPVVT